LLDRALKIFSEYELIHIKIVKIRTILISNDYPVHVIDEEIKKFLNNKYTIKEKSIEKEETVKKVYLVLPYFNHKVETHGEKLMLLTKKYFDTVELKCVYETPSEIGKLFPFKEKINDEMQAIVV